MNARLLFAVAALAASMQADAHRLDEYLQATTFSLERNSIQAQMRLTPGVQVFSALTVAIDANGDGVLSKGEQRIYAGRVLQDLSLKLNGVALRPRLISFAFPTIEKLKDGDGIIEIRFSAAVRRTAANRELVFENHHQNRIAAYLVNCLVPRDANIRITAQNRDYRQSVYTLSYEQINFRHSARR